MQKNYYVILGITSDASVEEIRAAFRRRARELHPDHSGLESGPFLEVQEAYGVLSDPERRRHYDRQGTSATRRRPWGPAAEPLVRKRPSGEPFGAAGVAGGFREVSLAESFREHRPCFEELFERIWSNFDSFSRPKAEHLEGLTVEIVISPEEARRGGRVQVDIPARATCPACGGHGREHLVQHLPGVALVQAGGELGFDGAADAGVPVRDDQPGCDQPAVLQVGQQARPRIA